MRTGDHRRQFRAGAFTAQKHITHAVDPYTATGCQRPVTQLVACLTVLFAERQAGDAVFRDGPELRHVEQALPQAFAIHLMRHFFSPGALAV
ncbi:hypothetical protein D3C80_1799290 [compost metagenome]